MGCRAGRVGKVSGIDASGMVLGMPEMPDTKQPFERPKCTKLLIMKSMPKIVYTYIIEVADSESDLNLCNREV